MDWMSLFSSILYYIALPVSTIFWLLVRLLYILLSPFIGVIKLIIVIIFLLFQWLAKFETIITYLGFAALIGLATGTFLHFSSNILVQLLNMRSKPQSGDEGRTAASVRAAREQKAMEKAWPSSSSKPTSPSQTGSDSLEERYSQWLERDPGNAKKNIGLFGQTILEEDDSSMDGY